MDEIYYSCICGRKIRGGGRTNGWWRLRMAVGWRKWVFWGLKSATRGPETKNGRWSQKMRGMNHCCCLESHTHIHKEVCKFDKFFSSSWIFYFFCLFKYVFPMRWGQCWVLICKNQPCVMFEILVPPWMLLVSIVEALALHPTVDSHTCTDWTRDNFSIVH